MTGIIVGAISVIGLVIGYKVLAGVVRYAREVGSAVTSAATDF